MQPHEVHDASTETTSVPPAGMISRSAGTGFEEQKVEHNTGYTPDAAGHNYAAGQDYPAVPEYPAAEGYPPAVQGYAPAPTVQGYDAAPAVEGYAGVEGYAAAPDAAVPSPGGHGVDVVQNYPEVSVAVHMGATEELHPEEVDQSTGAPTSVPQQQQQQQPQQEDANGLLDLAEVKESNIIVLEYSHVVLFWYYDSCNACSECACLLDLMAYWRDSSMTLSR